MTSKVYALVVLDEDEGVTGVYVADPPLTYQTAPDAHAYVRTLVPDRQAVVIVPQLSVPPVGVL